MSADFSLGEDNVLEGSASHSERVQREQYLISEKKCCCADVHTLLFPFLDADISETVDEIIQAHINGCEHCQEAIAAEIDLRGVISKSCQSYDVPQGLSEKVISALHSVVQTSSTSVVYQDGYTRITHTSRTETKKM